MSYPPGLTPFSISEESVRLLQEGRYRLNNGDLPGAADIAQALLRRQGSLPEAWVLLCSALIRMGSADDDRALGDALASIPVAHPAHPVLAVERARVLAKRGRYNEAVQLAKLLEANVRLTPRQHDILSNTYTTAGMFEQGLTHAELAVKALGNDPIATYNYALVLRYLGRTEEAIAGFERVITAAPDYALAYFSLADCRRWTPARNHIPEIRKALQVPGTPDLELARLNYALFKEAHDIGEHELAWQSLSEGARLAGLANPYLLSERTEFVEKLIATFQGNLDAAPAEGPEPVPIFIVGLPRSGTTLVERILSAHPDVTDMGETHGFALAMRDVAGLRRFGEIDLEALQQLGPVDWSDVGRRYLESLNYRQPATRFFTEKLPHNYHLVGAMRLAFPQARFIHLRRAPMDSLFGAFKVLFGEGSYLWSYRFEDLAAAYRLYRRVTDHWRAELRSSFVEVTLESLIDTPETEIRRLLADTGLSFHANCLEPHKASGGVSTASSTQVRQPINRQGVGAWRTYARELEPLRRMLEEDGYVDSQGDPLW